MKKVIFEKLKVRDFLSIGSDWVEIDYKSGIHQIEGINHDSKDRKNGTGKTTIVQGHYFALFGETVNKIKSEYVVNHVTKKKGNIELYFHIEKNGVINNYVIKRQLKPSKVELWENGEDITRDSIANTNKKICELISSNPLAYKCCDVLTVRDTKSFMDMESEDKRKFIEEMFDIGIFAKMAKILKPIISKTKEELVDVKSSLSSKKNSISDLDTIASKLLNEINRHDTYIQDRINENLKNIEEIKWKYSKNMDGVYDQEILQLKESLVTSEENLNKVTSKENDTKIDLSVNRLSLSKLREKIYKLENDTNTVCPSCNQAIPESHIHHVKSLIQSANEDITKLVEESSKLTDILNKCDGLKSIIKTNNDNMRARITQLQEEKREYEASMKTIEGSENAINRLKEEKVDTTIYDDTVKKIDGYKKEMEELQKELEVLEEDTTINNYCKFILSDEGVKSYVIKKLLTLLNNTIEKYLTTFGLSVRCKFDEYFDEVITTNKDKVFSYKNASGAEKKSMDFACLFSFGEMRRKINQVYSNVLFVDESLDNALDSKGLGLIMGALNERVQETNCGVYIISHRNDMKPYITGETIIVEKSGGITKINKRS